MLRGRQRVVVTPGQNRKRYIAGALAVNRTDLVFVQAERKNSDLFLALLDKLRTHHRRIRRIHLVLDNYGIHTSRVGWHLRHEAARLRQSRPVHRRNHRHVRLAA